MKWVSAVSTQVSLEMALRDIAQQVQGQIPTPDLGFLFVSGSFASEYPRVLPLLKEYLPIKHLIGCSGGGIIGGGWELEDKTAISLLAGSLPTAQMTTFHCTTADLPDLDSPPQQWQDLIGVDPAVHPSFVLLADAFTFSVNDFLQGMDFAYGGCVKVGGLASGGSAYNALFRDDQLHRAGLVGVAVWGGVTIDAVVAQGCRPIGEIMQVSQCDRNLILAVDDRPPLITLQKLIQQLSDSDRQLLQNSLFIGVVMDEFKAVPTQGDFLIRNIIGVDPRSGAIAIGDRIRAGQRVQLHLRDAKASSADLYSNLRNYRQRYPYEDARAVLLFSCLGRGERLYGKPNHDSLAVTECLGALPIGGFFCNGEIGPVSNTTFLHGYTAVLGIVRQV